MLLEFQQCPWACKVQVEESPYFANFEAELRARAELGDLVYEAWDEAWYSDEDAA